MEFPEKYDLRDHGLVTDVKFQNPWGTCWAFGAVGSLESNALLQGVSDPDYSENSLVWFSQQELKDRDAPDDTLEGPSVSGGDLKQEVYNMGGTVWMLLPPLRPGRGRLTRSRFHTGMRKGRRRPYRCRKANGPNITQRTATGA